MFLRHLKFKVTPTEFHSPKSTLDLPGLSLLIRLPASSLGNCEIKMKCYGPLQRSHLKGEPFGLQRPWVGQDSPYSAMKGPCSHSHPYQQDCHSLSHRTDKKMVLKSEENKPEWSQFLMFLKEFSRDKMINPNPCQLSHTDSTRMYIVCTFRARNGVYSWHTVLMS